MTFDEPPVEVQGQTDTEKKCWLVNNTLCLVVWKNWLIRKRHWLLTLVEIALPVALFLLIAYARSKIPGLTKSQVTDPTIHEAIKQDYATDLGHSLIYYTPDTDFNRDIIGLVQEKLGTYSNNIVAFENEDDLIKFYGQNETDNVIVGIVFNTNDPKKFEYTIRLHDSSFPWRTHNRYHPDMLNFLSLPSDYSMKNILSYQMALDRSYIEKMSQKEDVLADTSIYMEMFPLPPYEDDSNINKVFQSFMALITVFSFIFICPAVLKRIVEEKESGIKEFLKMVGMKPWMSWLGWYLHGIFPILFSIIFIVIILKVPIFDVDYAPVELTDGMVLFVFFLLYCSACICLCFFITTLFSKPAFAMVFGILAWILSYVVPKQFIDDDSITCNLVTVLFGLFPNMALHYGYSIIVTFEKRKLGVQWSNLAWQPSDGVNDMRMIQVLGLLLFDCFFYLLLTAYMDVINPGPFGVGQSIFWPVKYFRSFFQKSFKANEVSQESRNIYVENGEGKAQIEIKNLFKKFGTKSAVDDLSMKIYQNEITVLLGHNGAGKSTTMSILTGMLSATSGTIDYNGKNILQNMDDFKKNLGLCPQHNLLFPDLTVQEHLVFFGRLKGLSAKRALTEAKSYMQLLNIYEKRHKLPDKLSGGMKRKLCLSIALIGDSSILILDEPTSGLDAESRRKLWDLMLRWGKSRTILLTTHFMDEADALAQRIAIMSKGQLVCYGTPITLKKKYETGYHLNVILKSEVALEKINEMMRVIEKYVPGAKLKHNSGDNLSIILSIDKKASYPKLFDELENCKERFNIEHLSISITTLEDVFLEAEKGMDRVDGNNCSQEITDLGRLSKNREELTEVRNFGCAMKMFFLKRAFFFRNKWKIYLISALMAIGVFILSWWVGQSQDNSGSDAQPLLNLTLNAYDHTTVYYTAADDLTGLANIYDKAVKRSGSEAGRSTNVVQAIIDKGIENVSFYFKHLITAAEFLIDADGTTKIVVLYSTKAYHSAPIGLNLISDALAKYHLGADYSIQSSVWPLPPVDSLTKQQQSEVNVMLGWLLLFPIGILFLLGCFIMFPHAELSTSFIQIQFMYGLKRRYMTSSIYWFVNIVIDMLIASPTLLFVLIWLQCTQLSYHFWPLFVILFLSVLASLPYTYLYSRRKSAAGSFAMLVITNLFASVCMTLVVAVLIESKQEYYEEIGGQLKTVFLIFSPHFGLVYNSLENARREVTAFNWNSLSVMEQREQCRRAPNPCCEDGTTKIDWKCEAYKNPSGTTLDIWLMLIPFFLYFGLNVLIDSCWGLVLSKLNILLLKLRSRDKLKGMVEMDEVDGGTTLRRRNQMNGEKKCLMVRNIQKYYDNNKVVDGVTFNTMEKKCLGILGVNGAGKTSTFKSLTNEVLPEGGQIYWKDGQNDQYEYLNRLGYCPQMDYLNFSLTTSQILKSITILRGFDNEAANEVVENFMRLFDLKKFEHVSASHLSGGNKRKLCMAVSLIGFPAVCLMDEPTSGVDPASRRYFWNIIRSLKENEDIHMSFVLTSHSMVECETLCDNVIILKKGKIINDEEDVNKLKKSVGGYTVVLKLLPKALAPNSQTLYQLKNTLDREYELKHENKCMLTYQSRSTADRNKRLSNIFEEFQIYKDDRFKEIIEDYTISEASLEDVFMKAASEGNDPEDCSV